MQGARLSGRLPCAEKEWSEILRETDSECPRLRYHGIRLRATGFDLALGEPRQFRAGVERILQEHVHRPVVAAEAHRQVRERVRLQVANRRSEERRVGKECR